MESKLAKQASRDLLLRHQQLSPTQRLEAFLAQCQLVAALRKAGAQRQRPEGSK